MYKIWFTLGLSKKASCDWVVQLQRFFLFNIFKYVLAFGACLFFCGGCVDDVPSWTRYTDPFLLGAPNGNRPDLPSRAWVLLVTLVVFFDFDSFVSRCH